MPRYRVELYEHISGSRVATIEVDATSKDEAEQVAIDTVEPKDWKLVKSSGDGYDVLSVQEIR